MSDLVLCFRESGAYLSARSSEAPRRKKGNGSTCEQSIKLPRRWSNTLSSKDTLYLFMTTADSVIDNGGGKAGAQTRTEILAVPKGPLNRHRDLIAQRALPSTASIARPDRNGYSLELELLPSIHHAVEVQPLDMWIEERRSLSVPCIPDELVSLIITLAAQMDLDSYNPFSNPLDVKIPLPFAAVASQVCRRWNAIINWKSNAYLFHAAMIVSLTTDERSVRAFAQLMDTITRLHGCNLCLLIEQKPFDAKPRTRKLLDHITVAILTSLRPFKPRISHLDLYYYRLEISLFARDWAQGCSKLHTLGLHRYTFSTPWGDDPDDPEEEPGANHWSHDNATISQVRRICDLHTGIGRHRATVLDDTIVSTTFLVEDMSQIVLPPSCLNLRNFYYSRPLGSKFQAIRWDYLTELLMIAPRLELLHLGNSHKVIGCPDGLSSGHAHPKLILSKMKVLSCTKLSAKAAVAILRTYSFPQLRILHLNSNRGSISEGENENIISLPNLKMLRSYYCSSQFNEYVLPRLRSGGDLNLDLQPLLNMSHDAKNIAPSSLSLDPSSHPYSTSKTLQQHAKCVTMDDVRELRFLGTDEATDYDWDRHRLFLSEWIQKWTDRGRSLRLRGTWDAGSEPASFHVVSAHLRVKRREKIICRPHEERYKISKKTLRFVTEANTTTHRIDFSELQVINVQLLGKVQTQAECLDPWKALLGTLFPRSEHGYTLPLLSLHYHHENHGEQKLSLDARGRKPLRRYSI
jgi:hypothetical protein